MNFHSQHPQFTEEKVLARIERYNENIDELVEYYTWGQHINADQDPLTVFECLESALVNPLPKQLPRLSLNTRQQSSSSLTVDVS